MSLFNLAGIVLAVVTLFGYVNMRWIKLPDAIGMTAISLFVSVLAVIVGNLYPGVKEGASSILSDINFPELIFHGFLGILLFAGSLHVDLSALKKQKLPIILLSTVGVLISTFVVGSAAMLMLPLIGVQLSFVACLLFGAIISPTDPIAVMAILKKTGVPKSLETKIVGESLFNDGMAVVLFMSLLSIYDSKEAISGLDVSLTIVREVIGGLSFGLLIGYLGSRLLRDIDSYQLEVMTTLSMAIGGYALAEHLQVSAPIAVVVMGLFIGNHSEQNTGSPEAVFAEKLKNRFRERMGAKFKADINVSEKTRDHLIPFWDLLDEVLNLVLFALIGLQLVSINFDWHNLMAGLIAIPLVLMARSISVWLPLMITIIFGEISRHAVKIMTWGGLRGGISVALALSLPAMEGRDLVITMTYVVVVFSLLVQATTLGHMIKKINIGD